MIMGILVSLLGQLSFRTFLWVFAHDNLLEGISLSVVRDHSFLNTEKTRVSSVVSLSLFS